MGALETDMIPESHGDKSKAIANVMYSTPWIMVINSTELKRAISIRIRNSAVGTSFEITQEQIDSVLYTNSEFIHIMKHPDAFDDDDEVEEEI